jgi:hypothetical protein
VGKLTDKDSRRTQLVVLFQALRGSLSHLPGRIGLEEPPRGAEGTWKTREALFGEVRAALGVVEADEPDTRVLRVFAKVLGLIGQGARGARGCGTGEYINGFRMWTTWLRELGNSIAREAEERAKAVQRFNLGLSASGRIEVGVW